MVVRTTTHTKNLLLSAAFHSQLGTPERPRLAGAISDNEKPIHDKLQATTRSECKRLRGKAKIPYPQNAARHCFSSYHIALHEDGAKTAVLLGHPNPALLYSTYREVVTKDDALLYFAIVPRAVEEQQERDARANLIKLDAAAREAAECESSDGRAVRDSSGKWVPVDPIIPDDYEPIPVSDWVLENV